MKRCIFLLSIFLTQLSHLHSQDIVSEIEDGALILAKQFQSQNENFKAVCLISFLLDINDQNEEVLHFAKVVQSRENFRVYRTLPDNGKSFAKFLEKVIQENQNMPEKYASSLKFISKVVDPTAPFPTVNKENPFLKSIERYFPEYELNDDLFKRLQPEQVIDENLMRELFGKTPFEIARYLKVKNFMFNPQKLLDTINEFNEMLKPLRTKIVIVDHSIPYEEEVVVDGIKSYIGEDLDVKSKSIMFKEATIYDILKYIEHTLLFTFVEEQNHISVIFAENGENGRPEKFKPAEDINFPRKLVGLKSIVKSDFFKFRSEYHSKSIQLQGKITKIKPETNRLLIEINGHFVAEVDNQLLKPDTIKLIKQNLELRKTNASEAEKMLHICLRGTVKARSKTRTDITNCSSILAIDKPHFYLKH